MPNTTQTNQLPKDPDRTYQKLIEQLPPHCFTIAVYDPVLAIAIKGLLDFIEEKDFDSASTLLIDVQNRVNYHRQFHKTIV